MKKWMIYILALAAIPALSFGGFGGEDVGKLLPVQVIMVRPEGIGLRILTDSGENGWGEDVDAAIVNMNDSASARVFLDTADYLLLEKGTEPWISQLQKHLRPSCSLSYGSGDLDLEKIGAYLQLHEPKVTLTRYEAGERELPILISEEGRMELVQR